MGNLDKTISFINEELKTKAFKDKQFTGSKYAGLSTLVERKNVFQPCIIGGTDAVYCGKDDRNPITIYHRYIGSGYKYGEGFGDKKREIRAQKIGMLVTYNRKKIKLSPDDIEAHIGKYFPTSVSSSLLTEFGISKCIIYKIACDHNTSALHAREYKTPNTDPGLIILELQYGIECTYDNTCINTLCCDEQPNT
jgi:hypothetical protein